MTDAVVEIVDREVHVTLFPSAAEAEERAIAMAMENTAATREEVQEHLQQLGRHEEGDWAVHVVTALESEEAKASEEFLREVLGS